MERGEPGVLTARDDRAERRDRSRPAACRSATKRCTGALNGATVEHLLRLVPAAELAVVARDPDEARRFAARGVQVRTGDYRLPATLPAAFAGADRLLLVSSDDLAADAVALHRTAIDAAVTAGVGRILSTGHQGADPDSPFGPARDHARTERLLADTGLPWTSLHNGFYLHSLAWLLGLRRDTGVIAVPGDGRVSWTAREDAAEAAAVILTSASGYDGPVTLTANTAPTFGEVARTAGEVTGQSVAFEVLEPAARDGHLAGTDPLLTELLRREPRTVRDELAAPTGTDQPGPVDRRRGHGRDRPGNNPARWPQPARTASERPHELSRSPPGIRSTTGSTGGSRPGMAARGRVIPTSLLRGPLALPRDLAAAAIAPERRLTHAAPSVPG